MGELISQVFPLGACSVTFNSVDLGLTSEKGATLKLKSNLIEAKAAKYGAAAVAMILNGQEAEVDLELIQTSVTTLQPVFPGATLISGGGGTKMAFGQVAGRVLAAAAMLLTPILTQNSQSTNLIFTLSSAVPVGDFEAIWDGKNYIWKIKMKGIITVGLADGQLMGTFGTPSATQGSVATVSSVVPAENAVGVADALASITWTLSGALSSATVNKFTVLLFARPDSVADSAVVALQATLTNNGASTTIVATAPGGGAFSLAAATKYLAILTPEIQDSFGNAFGGYCTFFTTT